MPIDKKFDVLAIGELNADLIFTGLKQGPVLNNEILAENYKKTMGSSTALCACNIARIGLKVAFCGKVGDDEMGRFVIDELEKRAIDTGFCIIDPSVGTGVTLSLNWSGDRAMVTVMGAIETFTLEDFDLNILKTARHLHVGSFYLNSGLRKDLKNIFKKAHEWGISTSLDTGWDVKETWENDILGVLEHTDIFFPNETEAMHITRASAIEEAAAELEKLCRKTVAIKCGKKGALLLSGGKRYAIDAMDDVQVVDTTGAGDSFNAGFIYGYLNGLPLPACLEYGNACGNISVSAVGGTGADLDLEKITAMIEAHGRCREM